MVASCCCNSHLAQGKHRQRDCADHDSNICNVHIYCICLAHGQQGKDFKYKCFVIIRVCNITYITLRLLSTNIAASIVIPITQGFPLLLQGRSNFKANLAHIVTNPDTKLCDVKAVQSTLAWHSTAAHCSFAFLAIDGHHFDASK